MALGNKAPNTLKRKVYLSITRGSVMKCENGKKEYYQYIEGTLEDIYCKDRSFNGTRAKFWYMDLRDGEELYSLCFPYISGVFKTIVLCLSASDDLNACTLVRIEPKEGPHKRQTLVDVYADGEKLEGSRKDLPPVRSIVFGTNTYTDDEERMGFISEKVEAIRSKILIEQ